jgi:hypothetical protein
MRQIKGKPYRIFEGPGDITGEITIDDIYPFDPRGRMSNVCLMWETLIRFATLLDNAHAKEILSLEAIRKKYARVLTSEDELEHLFECEDLHSKTILSSKVLVNAAVLQMLFGFVEFTVKEILKLVEPAKPDCRWMQSIGILREKGIFTGFPESYEKHMQSYYDAVRNNFAHGYWDRLAKEVGTVDLDEALSGTLEFLCEMNFKLEEQGYDLTNPRRDC